MATASRDCGDALFEPRYDERFVLTASFSPSQPAEEETFAIEAAEKRRTRGGGKKMADRGKRVVKEAKQEREKRGKLVRDGMRKL